MKTEDDAIKALDGIFDESIDKQKQKIYSKYLDSFPCKNCNLFKKLIREIKSFWKTFGYSIDKQDFEHMLVSEFIDHFQNKHLPTKKETEILMK